MKIHNINIIKTKDVGNQIFVDGKYLTTYIGCDDSLMFQLENSGKTDLDVIKEIALKCDKIDDLNNENCFHVHYHFNTLLNYNYCPICGKQIK